MINLNKKKNGREKCYAQEERITVAYNVLIRTFKKKSINGAEQTEDIYTGREKEYDFFVKQQNKRLLHN